MNDNRAEVLDELDRAITNNETMILPLSAIIETGNHIAHLPNGDARRKSAINFSELLRKTARREFPWTLDKLSMNEEDLLFYADRFPEYAVREIGMGDLSIIHEFDRYVERIRGVAIHTKVRIWSLDHHLSGYEVQL